MKWFLLSSVALLLLGPLRKHLLREWQFTVPALLGGIAAWLFTAALLKPHDPWWMPWAVGVFVALGAGAAVKEWIDGIFGKDRK
jgi:hypothetical protein